MIARIRCCPRPEVLLILALVLSAPAAWAGNAKVKVCHVPPGNPANFHTITISENALQAHLGHGDLAGACSAHCDSLCSDDDPCTIDACNASEQCLNTHPPVNCNDGNLCTVDSCSAAAGGCQNTPKACADGNNCTLDACDPVTGSCVFPAVECPPGQACNPAQTNPVCEATATCSCTSLPGWNAVLADANSCFENSLRIVLSTQPVWDGTETAESDKPRDVGSFSCSYRASGTSGYRPFTALEQAEACVQLIRNVIESRGLTCATP